MITEIDPWLAIRVSLQVALWCVLLGLPVAVLLGWILARFDFLGKTLLNMLLFAPMVIPPVVTGYLLLEIFGRNTVLGKWLTMVGLPISFDFSGAVLAALVVGLPFFIMVARSTFEALDPRLEEVAWTLGSARWRTFWKVTLPMALPGIGAGALLAFARALGEFGATIVLAGNVEGQTRTIALAIYTLLESPAGDQTATTLVLSSLALSFAALVGYEILLRWHRRRMEWRRGL